jgi:taurine dioxygenase
MPASIEVIPTGASLGADVAGVDLSQPIADATFAEIYKAWNDHLVIRFRGQNLDEDALIRFSARFGELDDAPVRAANSPYHRTHKKIAVMSNIIENGKPLGGLGNSELVWHQDMSYKDLPPKASLLYGIETPATGGSTEFYNLYAAYETLPADLKQRIQGLSCKHDATRNSAGELRAGLQESYPNEERPGAVHPLTVRHADTGRTSLYLGRRPNAWIVGLSGEESDALLDRLWDHIQSGDHYWSQNWKPGDLVIWDNRCTLHRRDQLDPNQRRHLHRTQVQDEARPVAA